MMRIVGGSVGRATPSASSVGSQHLSTPPGPLHPQPRPLRPPVLRRPRPTPMMTGTLSLTHTASPRLLVAPAAAVAQPADAAGASRLCSRQASPSPAQSRQALYVERILTCSLWCSARFRLAWRRWLWVLSLGTCTLLRVMGSVGGRGLFLALLALAVARRTARQL